MLNITGEIKTIINSEGEKAYPYECCGVMLGTIGDNDKTVCQVLPIINAREDKNKHNRFLITPDDMLSAQRKARELKLDVVGFYHSHPDHSAVPSDYDTAHAMPFYSYIIVSVIRARAGDFASFVLAEDRSAFINEEIFFKEVYNGGNNSSAGRS